ncbi:MAG: N-acetylmuramoyl-L-alanine amidase [Lachnospiraceae bacterium]|nr:N-acetylmuramoyl-L-alanine amidase [Lachnospiraceae bacterium]
MKSKLDWRGWMTLALWTLLCTGCMTVMMWWAAGKSIVIADTAPGDQEGYSSQGDDSLERYRLTLEEAEGKPRHFTIPVSPAVHAEQISIENRYTERQLWIYIQGAQASDYRDYVIAGDISSVVGGWAQQQEDMTILKLQMNTIHEYSSVMEENRLYVEYMPPEESYERIVVIDPLYGGEEWGVTANGLKEKEIALQIARAVRQQLDGSEIKVYLTRQEDAEVSPEDRILLVREVNADLYVGIGVGGDEEDPEQFGTEVWYNGDYFLPGFGNLQLADLLERRVTEAVSGRANGLIQTQDSILQRLTIPGALLKAGYLTHEREGELLGQQGYIDKVAEGIVEALRQAFDELEAAEL